MGHVRKYIAATVAKAVVTISIFAHYFGYIAVFFVLVAIAPLNTQLLRVNRKANKQHYGNEYVAVPLHA